MNRLEMALMDSSANGSERRGGERRRVRRYTSAICFKLTPVLHDAVCSAMREDGIEDVSAFVREAVERRVRERRGRSLTVSPEATHT